MSQPTTKIEKKEAVETHERNVIKQTYTGEHKEEVKKLNPQYDLLCNLHLLLPFVVLLHLQ